MCRGIFSQMIHWNIVFKAFRIDLCVVTCFCVLNVEISTNTEIVPRSNNMYTHAITYEWHGAHSSTVWNIEYGHLYCHLSITKKKTKCRVYFAHSQFLIRCCCFYMNTRWNYSCTNGNRVSNFGVKFNEYNAVEINILLKLKSIIIVIYSTSYSLLCFYFWQIGVVIDLLLLHSTSFFITSFFHVIFYTEFCFVIKMCIISFLDIFFTKLHFFLYIVCVWVKYSIMFL